MDISDFEGYEEKELLMAIAMHLGNISHSQELILKEKMIFREKLLGQLSRLEDAVRGLVN